MPGVAGCWRPITTEDLLKVSDVMTSDVQLCTTEDTVEEAAEAMAQLDVGLLPVAEDDHLVGMITDRDLAIRVLGKGRGPDTKIKAVMTPDVKYCFEDQDLESVCWNMGDIQVRRLPVLSRQKRLVGILSWAISHEATNAMRPQPHCSRFRAPAASTRKLPRRRDTTITPAKSNDGIAGRTSGSLAIRLYQRLDRVLPPCPRTRAACAAGRLPRRLL